MARTTYAHPVDVLRKFNPTLLVSDLSNLDFIGTPTDGGDEELIRARIAGVEDEFEDLTGAAYRERRQGNPGDPATYEYHEADFRRYQRGQKVWLDHRGVLPLDGTAGDSLEIRTGRDRWKDITTDEGQFWEADYRQGWIRVFGLYRYAGSWAKAIRDRNIRVCYRHGSLGGSRDAGGETSLDSNLAAGDATASVADASRLPAQGTVLVGGDEYVRYTARDLDTDELQNVSRGLRGTTDAARASGAQVHYCPMAIREAIAARTAVELLEYDDWVDSLVEATEGFAKPQKVKDWNGEWSQQLAKHSEARMF